jgi:REP element-mobilizing transposase RayT
MPLPRRLLVDDARRGAFHLISRCVRRAFLCGDAAEHRRAWVRDLLRQAAGAFAVDVLAYAVMSNHLHVVVRTDPDRVNGWSADEVAARWAAAHPRLGRDGSVIPWSSAEIAARAADAGWVAKARLRLRSLSWFMKSVKEQLSRRANREDRCTGAFWEGRFRSVALLDQAAVIAAMAYVDLNPIRARVADRPETSDFTSIQERCQARQSNRAARSRTPAPTPEPLPLPLTPMPTADEAGLWIAPILAATVDIPIGAPLTPFITLDDYLTLVDTTGRIVREGKSGAIPASLAPILERLRLDLDGWLDLMACGGHLGHGAIGALASRAREALRRGAQWIVDRTAGLYQVDRLRPTTA